MKFEKSVARLIVLYVALCFVILIADVVLHAGFSVLFEFCVSSYGFIIFSLFAVACVVYYVVRKVHDDKEFFIKQLVAGNAAKYKMYRGFKRLEHAYSMVRHIQNMAEEESYYLDSLSNYYNNEILNLEREIEHCRSKKQKTELELEVTELKFVAIANSIDDGILVVGWDGRVTFANNALIHRFPTITVGDHLSGVFNLSLEDCELFLRSDYKDVEVRIWDKYNSRVVVSGSRVFSDDKLCNVVFIIKNEGINGAQEEMVRRNQGFNFVSESLSMLSGNVSEGSLRLFLERLCLFGEFGSASIRIISDDKKSLNIYTSYHETRFMLNNETVDIKKSNMGKAFESQRAVIIRNPEDMLIPEPHIENALAQGLTVSYFPLSIQNADIGVLSLVGRVAPSQNTVLILKSVCINLAIALEKILLYDTLKDNYFDVIKAFLKAYELKIKNKRGHSARVANICRMMAEKLYYDEREIDKIYNAALLHDVGKMLVMDESDDYEREITDHAKKGRQIMEKVGFDEEILQGIELHHEDYRTERGILPIYPQFIRLANDFDSYVEAEPTKSRAREFIKAVRGGRDGVYSPNLVNVLENIVETDTAALLGIFGARYA